MPRVKIDYVVSFSSEDSEHPASNLLSWEVSKKKWLCQKGESSCSVVLQLTKAVKISSVHIGAYHSALVEVLVARSEKASDQFQVLVPSCVFVPPAESRRGAAVERVRSFSGEQLAAAARDQRWDRLRVVCSQPYNKHCKYGLSFIHIDSPNSVPAPAPRSAPALALPLDALSSDEEEFRPGELFAMHSQNSADSQNNTTSNTGAQIRQATSQALKNIPESSTKLHKTPISKPSSKRDNNHSLEDKVDRSRDTLLYTDDDEKPHTKIDQVVQRHKDQKEKEDKAKPEIKKDRKERERLNESGQKAKEEKRIPKRRKSASLSDSETPARKKANKTSNDAASDHNNRTEKRKPPPTSEAMDQDEEESPEPHTILKDVVLVLSGYENPQRANVRNTALALGARVERDWGPACTHLICAFPNTPKLRAVRAVSRSAPAVRADWVLQCAARKRRLPCEWFATESARRVPEPHRDNARDTTRTTAHKKVEHSPQKSPAKNDSDTECDTDDEIQKVLEKQKAKLAAAPSPAPAPRAELSGPSTDEDEAEAESSSVPKLSGALPEFFAGCTFAIDDDDAAAALMTRYVHAYGGLAIPLSTAQDSSVDYVLSARAQHECDGTRVSPAWLARCHREQRLLPPDTAVH